MKNKVIPTFAVNRPIGAGSLVGKARRSADEIVVNVRDRTQVPSRQASVKKVAKAHKITSFMETAAAGISL